MTTIRALRRLRTPAVFVFVVLAWLAGAGAAFGQTQQPQTQPAAKPAGALVPLPLGAKIAFVNLQIVFNESDAGKQGQEQVRLLNQKLFAGLSARDKEIQGLSDKIKAQQNLVADAMIQAWNQDLARLQREAQFARQEAQIQSEALQQQVLAEFEKKIRPVIEAVRIEKNLHAIVGVQNDPGGLTLLASEPGMDLSAEIVRRLNAAK
jgi:Skp family chaperone for outer membrane proteins